jgi:hypothetical protein
MEPRQIVWFVMYGLIHCRAAQSGLNDRIKTRVWEISEAIIATIQINITLIINPGCVAMSDPDHLTAENALKTQNQSKRQFKNHFPSILHFTSRL